MTQNSNRGNAPRHPRSPLPNTGGRPQGNGNSAALFSAPPKKQMNWLQDDRAPQSAPAPRVQPQQTPLPPPSEALSAAPLAIVEAHAPANVAATASHTPATVDGGFAALGLREELVRAVLAHGYSTPTPIQKQAIPAVLEGGDLLGGAQTGTGKTAGFVLPMLQRLMLSAKPQLPPTNGARGKKLPRALILAPTRELAAQVEESVRIYGKFLPMTSTCIFGGVGINPQIQAMRHGVDIVVATPGRLLDLYSQGAINFSQIEILVLDEADRMLDMGFIHDIKKVLAVLPPKRQTCCSAPRFLMTSKR